MMVKKRKNGIIDGQTPVFFFRVCMWGENLHTCIYMKISTSNVFPWLLPAFNVNITGNVSMCNAGRSLGMKLVSLLYFLYVYFHKSKARHI